MNHHSKNIGALKADYEAGIYSKVDIAKKNGMSPVTLGDTPRRENGTMGGSGRKS